jgi:hypothetical protein
MSITVSQPSEVYSRRCELPFFRPKAVERPLVRRQSEDELIRTDRLNVEQLRYHARRLADRHRLAIASSRNRLLHRLDENACVLQEAHRMLSLAAQEGHDVSESAIWLLDNYYLIRDSIQVARRDLPRKYSMGLPVLTDGPCEGLPRVYELALELIVHLDGLLSQDTLHEFVSAYQGVSLLTLGELWAVPIMLRMAGIENLRRLALPVVSQQHDADKGRQWADRIGAATSTSTTEIQRMWCEMVADERPLTSAFVAAFTRRLSDHMPTNPVAADWLAQYLSERGQTLPELVDLDSHNRAADAIAVRNSILSLRILGALDWKRFVEEESVVEQALRRDPAGVYRQMDFESRDHYRHVVEKLAQNSSLTEQDVSMRALELAKVATE